MLKSNYKNNLILNSLIDLGDDIAIEGKGKGRKFVSRFIEPGVAHYEEFGDVLITKETLNKFINTMVGCPVIIKHKDIDDKNADKERVGVISNVWFNEMDGWFYCDGIIWDKQAIDLVKNQGWNVSCTYDFESDKQKKTHNGKQIDMEFTGGEFLHLALVPNPRYERASIVMNSKEEALFTVYNDSDQDLSDTSKDRWITIHPNGEEGKGRPLLIKAGKTVEEAIKEKFHEWAGMSSRQQKLFDVKEYSKSKEEIKKDREEQKKADKLHEKITDIEDILKYDITDKQTREILEKDLKSLKESKPEEYKEDDFEKETKSTKKDEDKHQKVRDLEDKAYKEFKTMYDNYIDKDGMEGWGGIPASRFDKAKEQFNKKYKDAFDKLESDRFVSFEDFAKRENKQSDTKDKILDAIAEVVTNCLGECRNSDKEKGIWRTIKGTHIFIKDGESVDQAFKRATGKNLSDKTQEKDTDKQEESQNDVLNLSKQYVESLTKPQKEALTIYTDDERYTKINAYLRGDRGNIDTKTDKTIKELDKAFKNAELSSEITVYRGVRADFIEKALEDTKFKDRFEQTFFKTPKEFELDNIKNHFVGKEFTEKGFMSSSYDKNKAFQNTEIMLTVNLKKGAKALNVSSLSAHDEAEILINRGYNFRISDVQIDKNPYGKARWNFILDMSFLS